ncbi:MAG: anaerobic sulfatase maturase [Bryobacteraceae bacterium]
MNPFPILNAAESDAGLQVDGPAPQIASLLIKPASALCNLDCTYCFYLDREADPYEASRSRIMSRETLQQLVRGYLEYSHPKSAFAFQGGEPTLAGLDFFRSLVEFQQEFGGRGQAISNSIQTNGTLLNAEWCRLFREYEFLVGLSLDGPQDIHDAYRVNKGGQGTFEQVMAAVKRLKRERVEFNVLTVVSQANVRRAAEVYRYFRDLGLEFMQFIPLVEYRADGRLEPFSITGEEYGDFLSELFEAWWPERRTVRVRHFDNIAEALAGQLPGTCTMHGSCHSYAVVEHNGDVYPCDFFVERTWKLGNIHADSWPDIAGRVRRHNFAAKKATPHATCAVCEYQSLCHGGCPSNRHAVRHQFEDLDPMCAGYKKIYAKSIEPLRADLRELGVL